MNSAHFTKLAQYADELDRTIAAIADVPNVDDAIASSVAVLRYDNGPRHARFELWYMVVDAVNIDEEGPLMQVSASLCDHGVVPNTYPEGHIGYARAMRGMAKVVAEQP